MASRKPKKATRLFHARKLKPRAKKKSKLELTVLSRLPHNAEVIRTQTHLDALFEDIKRAQKASGKEVIIIWLR